MIDPSKLIIRYKFKKSEERRENNYKNFIVQTLSDRYMYYPNFQKSLYMCPVFTYVDKMFFVLDYRLDRYPTSQDQLLQLIRYCSTNKFYLVFDGVTLRMVSTFVYYYNSISKDIVDYYYNYYRIFHEPKIRTWGFRIVEDKDIFDKFYPRLGIDEQIKKPIIPIINNINFDQFNDIINSDDKTMRNLNTNLYFNYEVFVKKFLVPGEYILLKQ